MSVAAHRTEAHASVSCFVLTVSDTRTLETETSGRAIAELLSSEGHAVVDRQISKDDPARVREIVDAELARGRARAIITTGGTGLARRDSSYEALVPLFEKRIDGFGELFRVLSYEEIGSAAMMSRAAAGIARGTVLFLLPGSEAAVRLAMTRLILPELGHLSRELTK